MSPAARPVLVARPARVAVVIAAILLGALTGCGAELRTASGIVLSVEGDDLAHVDGFTLRTGDGTTLTFSTRETRFDKTGFPAAHLREHRLLGEPVRVTYQVRGGVNHVVKLEDEAPGGPGHSG